MKKLYMLEPTKEWHSKDILKGQGDVTDLAITRLRFDDNVMPHGVMSVWKAPFWARLKFLFSGKVNFVSMSVTHPPIHLSIGEYITKDMEK